jgi:hypothetical protein
LAAKFQEDRKKWHRQQAGDAGVPDNRRHRLVRRDRQQPDPEKADGGTEAEQASIDEYGVSRHEALPAIDQDTAGQRERSGDCGGCRGTAAEETSVVALRHEIAHPGIPGAAGDGGHRLIQRHAHNQRDDPGRRAQEWRRRGSNQK